MDTIGAVILAAGGSTRLGRPKQLLSYRGETLVRRTARTACSAGCSPVIVVVGDESERIAEELDTLEAHVCHHGEWRRGIGSSIRAGVEAALATNPLLDALAVMVCDQPYITENILIALFTARRQTQKRTAACVYAGSVGVPAIFDRGLFPLLVTLPDGQGAKAIIARLPEDVASVEFPLGVIDIDTPADCYAHLGAH